MHKREDILVNQNKFRAEIVKYLKSEFKLLRQEIKKIKSVDENIAAGKKSLLEKSAKVNVNAEIDKFFISWKNVIPVWYAWWDEESEQVLKLKYIDNL